MRGLVTFAAFGGLIPTPILVAVAVLVIAVVVGLVAVFLFRGGKKKAAGPAAMPDWQRQQAGAGGQQNPWGQQGQQAWGQQAQQPGSQAGWGMPATQQPSAAGWGAQAAQQSGGWGTPAAQQPGGWDAAAQQPSAAGWGTPAAQQQPGGWGTPAAQQPQGWGSQTAGAPGMPATQQPWAQQQAVTPPPQDPWAQQQQQQAVPAWGGQNNQQQAPASYGAGTSGTNQGWDGGMGQMGQMGQPAQGVDPWAQQAQGGWPGMAGAGQQQPVSPAPGSNVAQPAWQQGGFSQGQVGQPVQQAQPGYGGGFDTPDGDRTVLGPVGAPGPAAQSYTGGGYVRVEEGKEPGRIYEVRKDTLTIGRSRESDIFLEDLAVSRQHASIVSLGNGNYALRDEGSANGTKVNGQMVNKYQPYPLHDGDKIQLGQTVLVFARH
jgi:hypothetical protein